MSNEDQKIESSPSGGGSISSSSNNKKKRNRNKKKSKNNKEGSSSSSNKKRDENEQQQQSQNNNAMNPHVVLRNDINSQGYSYEEIDKVMEEMWDKGLAYDEVDAVLSYLKTGGEGSGTTVGAMEDGGGTGDIDDEEEDDEMGTRATDDSTKYSEGENDGAEEEKSCGEQQQADKAVAKPAPMTMIQKLDMVADFENMTDAVFALTEWVNKAAKPKDIGELCGAQNTKALPKIFCRAITECEENNKFETLVLPAMDRLMIALLGKCGVGATSSFADTRSCFESLMKQARRVYLMQQPGAEEYANRVSLFIVSRIAMALEECQVVQPSAVTSTTMTTGNGIKPSTFGSNGANDSIAGLLSARELHKTSAKRFSLQARSACSKLSGSSGNITNGHAGEASNSSLDKADVFLAIGGSDVKDKFDEEIAKLEELKDQMKALESVKATELQTKLDEVQSERKLVAERIAELKVAIENLESHDSELCKKVVQFETELDVERTTQNSETRNLEGEIQQSQKAIRYGTSIGTLVDLLKKYDDALDVVVNGSTLQETSSAVDKNSNLREVASTSMEQFSSRAAKYFAAEAQCVDFLRKRIDDNTKEIPALKKEIEECEGLGMTTTIVQMEESLKEKEGLLVTDAALVERLTDEAAVMYATLIGQLEQYAAMITDGNVGNFDALESIPVNAARLGIKEPERVSVYVEKIGSPQNNVDSAQTNNAATSVGAATRAAPTATETIAKMPKFTWAATGSKSGGSSAPKTSLKDIQQQELESRNL